MRRTCQDPVPQASAFRALRKMIRDPRVRFLLIGGVNTAFSTALFSALVLLFGPEVPAAASLGIAWTVSLLLAFFAYRRLVFRVSGHLWRDFGRFVGVNVGGLMLNAAALTLLVDVAGLPPIPTQVGITVLIVVFNYVGHRHFSFRRRPSRTEGKRR